MFARNDCTVAECWKAVHERGEAPLRSATNYQSTLTPCTPDSAHSSLIFHAEEELWPLSEVWHMLAPTSSLTLTRRQLCSSHHLQSFSPHLLHRLRYSLVQIQTPAWQNWHYRAAAMHCNLWLLLSGDTHVHDRCARHLCSGAQDCHVTVYGE